MEARTKIIEAKLANGATVHIQAMKPREIIALDSVFHDSDELKTNLDLQCRDAGIKFTCL